MRFDEKNINKEKSGQSKLSFNSDGSINLPDSVKDDLEKKGKVRYDYLGEGVIVEKNFNGFVKEYKQMDFESFSFKEREDKYDEDDEKINDIFDNKYSEINYNDDKEYHNSDDVNGFNLYNKGNKCNALVFSNGKSQEDIVNEVVNKIKEGKKILFIRGVCGTGKSAIALNIAKNFKKTSIVVPGKTLQMQYMEDYSFDKYILKDNHKKLKIKVITGRDNHKCLFKSGESADFPFLPCKIDISEKNMERLKEFLRDNPKVKNDLELKEIRRMSIAPVCPYWSPIVPSEIELNIKSEKIKYQGLNNINYTIHNRNKGCSYYNQFNSYVDSDAIVFNSAKYKLESVIGRKPFCDVEIIDECDEFLDSFSNSKKINLTRLANSLNFIVLNEQDSKNSLKALIKFVNDIIYDYSFGEKTFSKDIEKLNSTRIYDLFNEIMENQDLFDESDEDSYSRNVLDIIKEFYDLMEDSYVLFSHDDKGLAFEIVSTNLSKKFQDLLSKNNALVLMSGTIHSEIVLKNIFGIKDYEIIDAESINQGEIDVIKSGFEIDCKYENFKNGNLSRENYLIALDEAVRKAPRPTLIHVNSFSDLPNKDEKENYNLKNLILKQDLIDLQYNDKNHKSIYDFKKGKNDVLFTTKCARGIDFPHDQCRSIIFTKYPNPDASSVFWKILKKSHSDYYWAFYRDKATREFLQKIYRGVRSKNDHVFILSPDLRVIESIENIKKGNL